MTHSAKLIYTSRVPETTGTQFGDWQQYNRRTYRPHLAVFLCPYTCVYPLWVGVSGDTYGYAGSLLCRFANPINCPPASFGDERAGFTPKQQEANTMAKTTHAPILSQQSNDVEQLNQALQVIDDCTHFIFTLQSQIGAILLSERHEQGGTGDVNYLYLCLHMMECIDAFTDKLANTSDGLNNAITTNKVGGAK